VRGGALSKYLGPGHRMPATTKGQLPDIQVTQTSAKSLGAAASFLSNVFRAIGITKAPGLDLSFAGKGDVVFRLLDVTYEEIDPVAVTALVRDLNTDLIPKEYAENGQLHVAYHYAYAERLEMRRADNKKFSGEITGAEIADVFKLGAKAGVEMEQGDVLRFKGTNRAPVAFAYKAGQLRGSRKKLEFFPGEVDNFAPGKKSGDGDIVYIPTPGVVPTVQDWSE
jgi:hypothetical protein